MRATSKTIYLTFTLLSILFFPSFIYADNNANDNCNNSEQISQLNNKTTSTSHNEDGEVRKSADENDYYYFNINTTGSVSLTYNSSSKTDLYFSNSSCANNRILNNGTSTNSTLNVSSGDKVYIRVKAESSDKTTYTLSLVFTPDSTGGRDFEQRHQSNLFGDVRVIGNTVLCIINSKTGECAEPKNEDSNAHTNLQKAPRSTSKLDLPENAIIEYARIYWQGRRTMNAGWDNSAKENAGKIKIKKTTSANYTELVADVIDIDLSDKYPIYSASADASAIVTSDGNYSVDTASFYTITGKTWSQDGLGAYGAWTLVVVYSDPDETTAKNITVFDGYKQVTGTDTKPGRVNISVDGFLTPQNYDVDSKVYVFTGEGDAYIEGDELKMAGKTSNTNLTYLGTFDSRIDVPAKRDPDLTNNNGIDIQVYDVGTTTGAKQIITNNETGASFQFYTEGDSYFPSLIVFSTELYLPQMCYDYSLKQDGRYFSIDRAAYPEAQIDQKISSSDIEVGIYLRNKESDLPAEGISISTDLNVTKFNQVGNLYASNRNGTSLIDRGAPDTGGTLCDYDKNGDNSVSNNGCTDGHNIRKGLGSLGEYDYVYTKFILQPQNINGIVDINESLGMSIKYYLTADGSKIEYPEYVLGGTNVPICPPTGAYQPQWGQFNVVRRGQANNNVKNNLYTQVSRKPFDTSVVFDSTPETGDNAIPESNINTTVLVEMIDIGAFGDINASCANPDANVSEPIFIPINFTPTNSQVEIPTQVNNYYNFALQNATFRVWYFDDNNESLIQDWSATTTDSTRRVLTSISDLYDSSVHGLCATSCVSTTSVDCFECIKINFAKPICARDNFAVRPESFSLNILDVNQSLPTYNIDTDPNNPKNLTKANISTVTGYAPSAGTPAGRMNLASGYNYRFDINASGNDGISLAPGYTRDFQGGNEFNSTLIWDPQTPKIGCNDIQNRNIKFYFKNGKVENEERLQDNVGEYRLNLIDRTWTAVDWLYTSHHTIDNGFDINTGDCVSNSSSTSGILNGCSISTDHGSDAVGNNYIDHSLTFHPYKFDMSTILPTVGINHTPVDADSYIYMSDISQDLDENMSYHLNGNIVARGWNNVIASNFVDGCYAKPLDLNISRNTINTPVAYRYRFHAYDENNLEIGTSLAVDLNNSILPISVQTDIFDKDLNGSATTILNLNYDRKANITVNPQEVTFISYDINCTTVSDCTYYGDLTNDKTSDGSRDLNSAISLKHYYGRTNGPRKAFSANNGTSFIFYEIHCSAEGLGTCVKSLLPGGEDSNATDDPRWFVNTDHEAVQSGSIGLVNQKAPGALVGVTAIVETQGQADVNMNYTGATYPYKATMQNNAPSWLIYNKYDDTVTLNEFQVEFLGGPGSWAGVQETDTTTSSDATSKTNRRSMW